MIVAPVCLVELKILTYGSDEARFIRALPRSASWTRNDARHADSARITLDFGAFPLDPRLVKDASVTVLIADRAGKTEEEVTYEGVFQGHVDEIEGSWATDRTLDLTCRDYTARFLDRKVPSKQFQDPKTGTVTKVAKAYNLDRSLKALVLEMFDDVGSAMDVAKKVFEAYANERLAEDPDHVLGRNPYTTWSLDVPEFHTSPEDDLWTVLSQVCDRLACIPYFDLDTLRVERVEDIPSNLFAFEAGVNVGTLRFKRNLNATVGRHVVLRAEDPSAPPGAPRMVEGRWPADEPARRLTVEKKRKSGEQEAVGDGDQEDKVKVVKDDAAVLYIQGRYPASELQTMARAYYEEARRLDLTGSITTEEFYALPVPGIDFYHDRRGKVDYLKTHPTLRRILLGDRGEIRGFVPALKNGDRLSLSLAAPTWTGILALPEAAAIAALARFGIDKESAAELYRIHRRAEKVTLNTWYVKKVDHTFTSSDGYSASIEFSSIVGADL